MEEEIKKEPEEKPKDKVEQAQAVAKLLEKLNIEVEENIKKLETLRSNDILGGANDVPNGQKKPEVSPEEYAKAAKEGKILE